MRNDIGRQSQRRYRSVAAGQATAVLVFTRAAEATGLEPCHAHLTKGDPPVDIDAKPVACTTPRRRATADGRWRQRARFAGAKHLNRERARMRVKRIGWAGTRTSEYDAMVAFLQAVLGLTTSQEGPDFAAFQLPEGGTFEVFGPRDQDHAHFSTGPVVGFVVDDLGAAVRELEAAGVELLGGQVDERGGGWRHFRAPDGNVYELTSG
jgi:predicted enzyme related to lactoylglutathione lyase